MEYDLLRTFLSEQIGHGGVVDVYRSVGLGSPLTGQVLRVTSTLVFLKHAEEEAGGNRVSVVLRPHVRIVRGSTKTAARPEQQDSSAFSQTCLPSLSANTMWTSASWASDEFGKVELFAEERGSLTAWTGRVEAIDFDHVICSNQDDEETLGAAREVIEKTIVTRLDFGHLRSNECG